MTKSIKLNPEVVRLAQMRARTAGSQLSLELARAVVEETVLELDPELEFVLDESLAFSAIDALACSLGANDVVINSKHIDVRVLSDDNTVTLVRALVGTPYLSLGSLVVRLINNHEGVVVGYIGPGGWLSAEQNFAKAPAVDLPFEVEAQFDCAATLKELCSRTIVQASITGKSLPDAEDLKTLFTDRDKLIVARQKQIVSAIVTNADTLELAKEIGQKVGIAVTRAVLKDSSTWTARVENFTDKIRDRFPTLTKDNIRTCVRKTGEIYGGEPLSPAFRRDVISTLSKQALVAKFASLPQAKVINVFEQVLSGRSVLDSVKELVKSPVAVDLAQSIKKGRANLETFVTASAEEIGAALKQLSLQPSYATHSTENEGGVETINEALQLLEVGDLAEQVKRLDQELAQT